MKHFEYEISGIDGSAAKFVGYCLDNSEEVVPDRVRPSVLVIPGGGYEMTSDREAEPIAMQFLAAGFNLLFCIVNILYDYKSLVTLYI